jgi:uncharacterized protein with FMN-binding domain
MRKIVIAVMSTLSGLVMLFSYHTSTESGAVAAVGATDDGATTPSTSSSSGSSGAASSSGSSGASGSAASSGSSGSSSGTFAGDEVSTRWGIVQVQITVANGKITKSEAIQYPTDNPKDQEINAYAVPQLNSEAVAQQSSSIDSVSGATVTSGGYIQSLQTAIDKAHL